MAPKRETALDAWGKELQYACESAGMTGKQLAEALHVVPATVSQWINGRRTPHLDDVERCDEALRTNGYLARYFKKWVTQETPSVWTDRWLFAEANANTLFEYDITAFPGLLQTEDYARAIIQYNRNPSIDTEEALRRRMARQAILTDENPPICVFVIDEYVLHRPVGGQEIMFDQFAQILNLTGKPNIVIKVVPSGAEYYTASPFMIAEVDGVKIAVLDTALRGQVIEGNDELTEINRVWEEIRESALSQTDSLKLIEKAMEKWET